MIEVERWVGESARAHKAAQIYCELGSSRTFSAVARRLKPTRTNDMRMVRRWALKWHWVSRAAQFDARVQQADRLYEERRRDERIRELVRITEEYENRLLKPWKVAYASYQAVEHLPHDHPDARRARNLLRQGLEYFRLAMTPSATPDQIKTMDENEAELAEIDRRAIMVNLGVDDDADPLFN